MGKKGAGNHITRREFIKSAAIGIGLAATSPLTLAAPKTKRTRPSRNKLKIPKTISANNHLMVASPTISDIGGGRSSKVLAYKSFPAPTLTARSGETVSIKLRNKLQQETITHWHGMMVDTPNDGGPQEAILPGESYGYQFEINQRAAFNWYHPHPHMLTGEQVNLGMAGGFIIRDAEEDALQLPTGKYEIPLIIRDAAFDGHGNLMYVPDPQGFFGNTPLVNGTLSPTQAVDRGVYRFRALNGANARVFRIGLSNNQQMTLIGNDGGLLAQPSNLTTITLGPAERLDLLIDFTALNAGATLMLRDFDSGWDLLEFVGTGLNGYAYQTPPNLSVIDPLDGPTDVTRNFEFFGHNLINGQSFEMDRIDFQVPFGVVERWQFYAFTAGPHPIHVHGASFQVMSRQGGRNRVFDWERGWKDTILLQSQETVDVLIRFDRHRGRFLLHCHNLEHEDMGMMSNFEVV